MERTCKLIRKLWVNEMQLKHTETYIYIKQINQNIMVMQHIYHEFWLRMPYELMWPISCSKKGLIADFKVIMWDAIYYRYLIILFF